jgi:glutathione S-transferase
MGRGLTIWGRITSINVRKVVMALQACGLQAGRDFERLDAGRQFGVTKTDAYAALNPNQLVPTLVDGDFVLWESNVIVRYLCAKHSPGTLYPADLQTRFDAERWMDWQQTTLNGAGREAFWQLTRTSDAERDMGKVLASQAAAEPLFAQVNAVLARQPFMAGAQFTMADIPIACEVHRWLGLGLPIHAQPAAPGVLPPDSLRPEWPHLMAWYRQVFAMPCAKGVLDQALA